jgi:hypothetical protein
MKLIIFGVVLLMALLSASASAQYLRTDLVPNQPGVATFTDPRLVNAWGLVALPIRNFSSMVSRRSCGPIWHSQDAT